MKTIIITFITAILLVSCIRENTATEDLMEMAPENAVLKYSGNFMQGPFGNNVNGKQKFTRKTEYLPWFSMMLSRLAMVWICTFM